MVVFNPEEDGQGDPAPCYQKSSVARYTLPIKESLHYLGNIALNVNFKSTKRLIWPILSQIF